MISVGSRSWLICLNSLNIKWSLPTILNRETSLFSLIFFANFDYKPLIGWVCGKHQFKGNNKDARATSIYNVLVALLLTFNRYLQSDWLDSEYVFASNHVLRYFETVICLNIYYFSFVLYRYNKVFSWKVYNYTSYHIFLHAWSHCSLCLPSINKMCQNQRKRLNSSSALNLLFNGCFYNQAQIAVFSVFCIF